MRTAIIDRLMMKQRGINKDIALRELGIHFGYVILHMPVITDGRNIL